MPPMWRVDIQLLYRAVETVQHYRRISAREIAREIGVSPSTLTRIKDGHRPEVDAFASIISWLKADPLAFITRADGSAAEEDERVLVAREDALIAWSWAQEALAYLPERLQPPKERRGDIAAALQRLYEEVGSSPGRERSLEERAGGNGSRPASGFAGD